MTKHKLLAVCILVGLVGCTTEALTPALPRVIQPGDVLSVEWSPGDNRAFEGQAIRDTVDCGDVISHPCPYLIFTTKLSIEDRTPAARVVHMVFDSAMGSDINGNPGAQHVPSTGVFTMDGDVLTLPDLGDDGGLRHAARITPSQDGYEGDVEWTLFNVAGYTTFHLTLTFAD